MIRLLKKAPPLLLFALTGASFYFSQLAVSLQLVGAAAYLSGVSYPTLVVSVSIATVLLAALIAKVLLRVSFRITGAIFSRKSGLLYPFPIAYGDFTRTILSFSIVCFLICGITGIPALFLPSLMRVTSAVRSVVIWLFLALSARYFLKNNAHDYDKNSLAFSLGVIPLVIIGLNVILTVAEVAG